jgi:hypothetical protein
MSLSIDGTWKAGVWDPTVWQDGVWQEGAVSVPDAGIGLVADVGIGLSRPPVDFVFHTGDVAMRFVDYRKIREVKAPVVKAAAEAGLQRGLRAPGNARAVRGLEEGGMSEEREAVIWCPSCREAKYEIHRIPTGRTGVYQHVSVPPNRSEKACACGALLERKP